MIYSITWQKQLQLCLLFFINTKLIIFSVPCDAEDNCHAYAKCVWMENELRSRCVCDPGYEGDGYKCVEHEVSCLIVSLLLVLMREHLLTFYSFFLGKHMRSERRMHL